MSTQRKAKARRTLWEGVVEGERHAHSATRGRSQTEAEIALRVLLLKHVRNWSFDVLGREVTLNLLAYRDFARIGLNKIPDPKTLARIAQALAVSMSFSTLTKLCEVIRLRVR